VPVETLMACPLQARGELLGVIVLLNRRAEGETFSQSDLSLLTALADQAAIAVDLATLYRELAEKERLEQELGLARSLQQMLLPRSFPPIAGVQIAAYSEPALEVGGDYYDIFEVDEDHVGIAVADVSGKGIPGAMVMATVRSTLRAEARNDRSPRAVLERLNARLRADTSANVFVTMTYGVLQRSRLRLRFARAGHEPLIVCGADASEQPRLYSPNGIALGLVDDVMFRVTEEGELQLHDQEVIVLYTDGVVEAMNKAHEEYGAERFLETLRGHASRSPEEIVEAVNADLRRFTRGIEQHDDITLVVLKTLDARENSAYVTSGRQIARA
jgi:sigma-B regulation protein RsbU (phosphoserine phosphatase)